MTKCQCYQGLIVIPISMYSRATLEDDDLDAMAEEYSDHDEELEEVPEEESDSESDVEIHDPRIEYMFELARKRWNFHPFVVDFLREFNQRDPIPEGPQGIQLLDDLAVAYDAPVIRALVYWARIIPEGPTSDSEMQLEAVAHQSLDCE
ncbi:hypothetical protein EDD22DRAFT_852603 [Suillus occidentalis]|nr:hypothetical protein EDD22DRAFT_854151 [Suillus occidentalis]KAG1733486.1 hypothetical protein EDD22DRAFT_852603 [Suillus occidentalis]